MNTQLHMKMKNLLEIANTRYQTAQEKYNWLKTARPNQLPPKHNWTTWLILAGRGFGKTRTGAETIRNWIETGKCKRVALIGHTEFDVHHVMINGESGLISVFPDHEKPVYETSLRRVTFSNGAIAQVFSSEAYENLRGPQFDGAWVDEFAKFRYGQETWDQLMFSLRLGSHPQVVVTTTPRPTPFIKKLMSNPTTAISKGTTFENSHNLATSFLDQVKHQYGNTNLGRQELYGDLLKTRDGALWSYPQIEKARRPNTPELQRIVISIDPALTHHKSSDETGIIVCGRCAQGHGYVLADLSGKYAPTQWAKQAVQAFHEYKADRIIAETNAGGDLISHMLKSEDPYISFKTVYAKKGKALRAEPIAALYEQNKIFHCGLNLSQLEDQMCSYIPTSRPSPDRLDALVWGLSELFLLQGQNRPRMNVLTL